MSWHLHTPGSHQSSILNGTESVGDGVNDKTMVANEKEMIETSFLPSPMVEFDANFLEVQIKIANKLVCSLLCLR